MSGKAARITVVTVVRMVEGHKGCIAGSAAEHCDVGGIQANGAFVSLIVPHQDDGVGSSIRYCSCGAGFLVFADLSKMLGRKQA